MISGWDILKWEVEWHIAIIEQDEWVVGMCGCEDGDAHDGVVFAGRVDELTSVEMCVRLRGRYMF